MRRIRQAAVLGAGIMGGGIAALLAGAGVKTLLLDIPLPDPDNAENKDPKIRNQIVQKGLDNVLKSKPPLLMHPGDAALIRVGNFEDDLDRLAGCDWMIEVVVENLDIKRSLLKRVEAVRAPGSIVSTNTSGIPLAKISDGFSDDFKAHFLGTHFFNPVRYMRLLEIIPGTDTKKEVLAFISAFSERFLGKGIVRAKDTPNFVGNRIGVHGMVKTMRLMVEEGLTIAEVDSLFGPALGRPKTAMFKTGDLVGLDTLAFVAGNTFKMCPEDEQRNAFKLPDFVTEMISKNLLGNKTGAGFYKKEKGPEGKIIRQVINHETLAYEPLNRPVFPCHAVAKKTGDLPERIRAIVYGDDKGARFAWKALAHNLIYAANRIPEISDTIVEIDNAMKWGFSFDLGPFETWDAVGLEKSVERMKKEGLPVPQSITDMLNAGYTQFYDVKNGIRHFFDFAGKTYKPVAENKNALSLDTLRRADKTVLKKDAASLIDMGDDVFCFEFHTKMNILNAEILEFMNEIVDFVTKNGAGLVIGNQTPGMPGVFSAGADLKYMGMMALQGRFSDMKAFVKNGQDTIQSVHYAPFPVVVAPYGLTLGGGCEICLGAADKLVAHAETYMGLPEVGVGLIPAGTGSLNLWKKMTAAIPEAVTVRDPADYFLPVFMAIATAKISSSAADARTIGYLSANDRIVKNRAFLIGEAKSEVLNLADAGYIPPVKQKIRVMGKTASGMVNAELFNRQQGGFVSEHDVFLAGQVAHVVSGGNVEPGALVDEETILKLERDAFLTCWRQPKTHARVRHMLETGKPLRN